MLQNMVVDVDMKLGPLAERKMILTVSLMWGML